MNASAAPRRSPPPRRVVPRAHFSRAAGWVVAGLATLVLCGWVLDLPPLKGVVPGVSAMNPQVALTFLAAGVCLVLRAGGRRTVRRVGDALAAVVLLSGALRLLTYLVPFGAGIDTLGFHMTLADGPKAGFMPPNAALAFALLGGSLLLADVPSRRRIRPAVALALSALTLSVMPLAGHLYGLAVFRKVTALLPVGPHIAAMLSLASLAALRLRRDRGLMACVTADSPAGAMARRMLPAALIVPLVIAALRVAGERAGLYGTEFGIAVMVVCCVGALMALTWWNAWSLHRADRERRRLAAAAESADRERASMRQAVAAMEQVLGVVGHELRTPLAALRLTSELLVAAGAAPSAEHQSMLDGISREAARMAETVNDLLEAARLNSGLAQWHWADVNVGQACEEALASVRPLLDPERVTMTLDVTPADLTIRGDHDAVRRLVVNLAGNAAKFTSDGRIDVIVRGVSEGPHSFVDLTVRDTGCGIAPHLRARLGQAFALNAGIVGGGHVSGAGLGLAICRGIVAAHGGTLSIESSVGGGTCVTARLRADLEAPCSTNVLLLAAA